MGLFSPRPPPKRGIILKWGIFLFFPMKAGVSPNRTRAPRSQATDFTPGEPNTWEHRYPERQPAQQKRSGQSDLDGHPEEVEHAHRARFEGPQANRHRSDRGRHRGHDEADENHPNLWHISGEDGGSHAVEA